MSRALPPDLMALDGALRRLEALGRVPGLFVSERAALEVYIAGRFRPMITDPQTWTNPVSVGILGPRRLLAERVVTGHPTVSTDELASATAALGPFLRAQERARSFTLSRDSAGAVMGASLLLLTFIAAFGLVWAVLLRGGLLLRTCGIAVVTRRWEAGIQTARPLASSGRLGSRTHDARARVYDGPGDRQPRRRAASGGRGPGCRGSGARITGSDCRHAAGAAMTLVHRRI